MEILLAKSAGFCFGVQRAVDTAYKHADEKNVYTYGQIIHNEEVVGDLAKHGVKILEDDELDQIKDSKVIIRSHGAEKRVYDILEKNGNEIIDATCPFVKKIHNIVMDECGKGHTVIIIGDGKHPEVKGIMGWCMSEPVVIGTEEEAEKFVQSCLNGEYKPSENISIVSQTTFNYRKFHNVVDIIRNKLYNVTAYKTICNATSVRQREAQEIASKVDAMIVIGGRNSSNTQKLYEISKKECENTYYIQTLVDLDLTTFESVSRVGITAGASTPNKLIKEVHGRMDEMNFAELLENDESRGSIKTGEIVEGRVIDVKPDEIIVDISYKSDGVIPRNEYTNTPNADLTELVHVGDAITAKVVKTNDGEGSVLLSYKRVAAEKANEKLEAALESGEILTGKVVQVVSGGRSKNLHPRKPGIRYL